MAKRVIYIISFLTVFSACIFDSWHKKIDDDFLVGYVDMPNQRNLYCLSQGMLNKEYVAAIDWNDSVIVIKANSVEKDTASGYYIINKQVYLKNHYENNIKNPGVTIMNSKSSFYDTIKKLGFGKRLRYEWD